MRSIENTREKSEAPRVGLEPTTNCLTGSRSTIELPRNDSLNYTILSPQTLTITLPA